MNNANSYFKMKSSLPLPSSFRKLPTVQAIAAHFASSSSLSDFRFYAF